MVKLFLVPIGGHTRASTVMLKETCEKGQTTYFLVFQAKFTNIPDQRLQSKVECVTAALWRRSCFKGSYKCGLEMCVLFPRQWIQRFASIPIQRMEKHFQKVTNTCLTLTYLNKLQIYRSTSEINYSPSRRSKPVSPSFIFGTQMKIFFIRSESFLT